MSRFLVLNFQDFGLDHNISETIKSQSLFCICCLRKDGRFYKLSSCTHKRYLDILSQLKTKLSIKEVVCGHCHSMLKRIDAFREQIQASYKILEEVLTASEIDESVSKINFEIKKTVEIDIQPFDPSAPTLIPNQTPSQPTESSARSIKIKIVPKTTNKHSIPEEIPLIDPSASISATTETQDPLQIKEPFVDVEVSAKKLCKNMSADVKPTANVSISAEVTDPRKIKGEKEVPIKMEVKLEPLDGEEGEREITVTHIEPPIDNATQEQTKSKITTVTLTKEELAKERLVIAQSEEYLKHPFKCEYCLIGFNYEDNLKDHMKRRHGPKPGSVTCEICLQVLYPPGSITAHNFRHFARSQCSDCGMRFIHYDSALQHCRAAHGKGKTKRIWRCRHCNFTTEHRKQLSSHKLKHEQFPCKDCGLVMTSQASYRRHLFFIHKKTFRKCSPCNKSFDTMSAYEAHMRAHGGDDARCEPCGVQFNTWHAYNSHWLHSAAHAKNTDNHNKSFDTMSAYGAHMRAHGGDDARCGPCGGVQFNTWHACNTHWLHSAAHAKNTDKYKCSDCSASFPTAAYLRAHARGRHKRAQAHHCPHCDKSFVLAVEMRRHIRQVHKERAVSVCDYCKRSYKSRQHLRRHIEDAHSDKLKKTTDVAPSGKTKKKH